MEEGFKKALKNITVKKIPMADGGEGTVCAIVEATGGKIVKRTVLDPLGRKIRSSFGISGDGRTAVIEMAEASGLVLLKPKERNPMKTSTYGTGQLIKVALKLGVSHILIGIGGSATNDGGTGMARALGVKFLDADGNPLPEGGGSLSKLAQIDMSKLEPRLKKVKIEVACDVDNPLTGKTGAAQVYGTQKGATVAMIKKLDAGLLNMAKVIKHDLGVNILKVPGGGAAGGLGAGLMAFVGGELRPGVDIVIDRIKLRQRMKGCDLVVTGEGRMDWQTAFGKTPSGVARVAKELGIPVIAICGCLGKDAAKVNDIGIDAFFSTLEINTDDEELPEKAPIMLRNCAEQVGRLIDIMK